MRKSLLDYGHFGSGQVASNSGQSSKSHPAMSGSVTIPRADLDAAIEAAENMLTFCSEVTEYGFDPSEADPVVDALSLTLAKLKGHRDAS